MDKKILKIARDFRDRLRAALGEELREVRAFGSRVRGDAAPDSDLDVLVLVGERTPELAGRVYALAWDVLTDYGVYVSPRVISESDFNSSLWGVTPFVRNVKREGVAV